MIKGLKITWASILLGLGIICIASGLYAPFNSSISQQKRVEQSSACLLFGVPIAAWGGWIFRGLQRDKRKAGSDQLNAAFARLLTENHGLITPLALSLETGLDGAAAKAFLDERAREFNANFDVSEEGDVTYRFHIGKLG